MSKKLRPWRVWAWDPAYNEYTSWSFATEKAAATRAQQVAEAGYHRVQYYELDENYYLVGTIKRVIV